MENKNTHGGKRPNAGAKKKPKHKQYNRHIHEDLFQPMDDHLRKLKAEFINEIEVKE